MKKTWQSNILLIVGMILLRLHCSGGELVLGGTGGTTETGRIFGIIHNPNGSPAANAVVKLVPVNYPGLAGAHEFTDSTFTNSDGAFSFDSVPVDSSYNLFADSDSGFCYRHSVFIPYFDSTWRLSDTLRKPGALRGVVRLNPGDDFRTVLILVSGANTIALPDSAGTFALENLAGGAYKVRFLSTLDKYAPLDTQLTVKAGTKLTLPDTIRLKVITLPNRDYSFSSQVVNRTIPLMGKLKAVDMDRDGDMDIVAAKSSLYYGNAAIYWFENQSTDTFQFLPHSIVEKPDNGDNNASYNDIEAIDLDKDGSMDILATSTISDNSGDTPNDSGEIVWFDNVGGTFVEHLIFSNHTYGSSIKAVDLDNDGDLDIISVSASSNPADSTLIWLENNGQMKFVKHIIPSNIPNAQTADCGDLDRDGDIDIVTSSYNDSKIAWFNNNGSGEFIEQSAITIPGAHQAIVIDLDNDGDLDVVTSGLNLGYYWFENIGRAIFTPHFVFGGASSLSYLSTIVDMDGDRDLDWIVQRSVTDNGITLESVWLENDGHRNFNTPHAILGGYSYICAADFNSDGAMDVVFANYFLPGQMPADVLVICGSNLNAK
jgi:hypothetical protein